MLLTFILIIIIIISILSPPYSFIPVSKPFFSANLQDWLHGFPGLFADISEHIRFLLFSFFLFFHFLVDGSLR